MRVREEWVAGFDSWRGFWTDEGASPIPQQPSADADGSTGRRLRRPTFNRAIDGQFLFGAIGAIGGIVVFVYLLGGAYMLAQIRQASLPTAALTYVSSRTLIRAGVVIALFSLALIAVLAVIVRPATRRFLAAISRSEIGTENAGEVMKALFVQLVRWLKHSVSRLMRRPIEPSEAVRVTGGSATLATLAGFIGEWTDLGFLGGVETFGLIGAGLLIGGLLLMFAFTIFNPKTGLSGLAALLLIVICVMAGAYKAGQIRSFRLPVAMIRLGSHPVCREASFLGETSAGVYVVNGPERRLEVVPWRTIAELSIAPPRTAVVLQAARSLPCEEAAS
jgi:hypothetical protein